MSSKKRNMAGRTGASVAQILAGIAVVVLIIIIARNCGNGSHSGTSGNGASSGGASTSKVVSSTPTPTPDRPEVVPVAADAEVWCRIPAVWAGPETSSPLPLVVPCQMEITDENSTALSSGDIVITDASGEARLERGECSATVLMQNGRLVVRIGYGELDYGAVTVDDCKAFQMMTASGIIELESWALIIYLPEFQLTLIAVLEGHGWLHPVAEIEGRSMAPTVDVPEMTYAYTVPDDRIEQLQEILGQADIPLRDRMPLGMEGMGSLIDVLNLHHWLDRARGIAEEQGVVWPEFGIETEPEFKPELNPETRPEIGPEIRPAGQPFYLRMGNLYPNDKLVSEAIIMAVPWQEVLDQLAPDNDVPLIVEHLAEPLGDVRNVRYDPEAARDLVAKSLSGQDDVAPRDTINLSLLVPVDDKQAMEMAQIMQEHLLAVGINLEFAGVSTSDLAQKMQVMMASGTLDLALSRR